MSFIPDDEPRETVFVSRSEILSKVKHSKRLDVIVVGGGIHGALFARIAAFNGLSTLLLERNDYACATSSRSSKMAHGGLRYLELFDLAQVFEGVKAREDLFETAPHLVKPVRFFIPVFKGQAWYRFKLGVGLKLYDLFLRDRARHHAWINAEQTRFEQYHPAGRPLRGGFFYTDGILSDTRLVIENIIAARQEGAWCLNHALVTQVSQRADGHSVVAWRDEMSGESFESQCGIVVNCAGPWVAGVGRIRPSPLQDRIAYSQGTHLLFRTVWRDPPLFLPLEGKSRYYWVWPHPEGALVGTTEREVQMPIAEDPLPGRDEVEEILARIARDLPGSGLDRSTLHYAFAGIRTLPLRKQKASGGTAQLSRKHEWLYGQGVLNLLGGKYTTAAWTAFEGLKKVYHLARLSGVPAPLTGRKLPGAGHSEEIGEFRTRAQRSGVAPAVIERAIARYGSRVRYFEALDPKLSVIEGRVLKAEILFAIRHEQAASLEDIVRRRTELEYTPDHGAPLLDAICALIAEECGSADLREQKKRFEERIAKIHEILS